jgi:hypothetical protein
MLRSPPRLDVRAWLSLALNGPVALLAMAVAATYDGAPQLVAFGVVMVLAPALALSVRAVEASLRGAHERLELAPARPLDHLLLIGFFLGLAGASAVLLAAAIRFRLDGGSIVWGLGVAGPPLGLVTALYVLVHMFRPAPGLRADYDGLLIKATGEVLAWKDVEQIRLQHRWVRLSQLRIVVRHVSGVLIVRRVPVPIGFPPGALSRVLRYARARMAGLEPAGFAQAVEEPDARRWQRAVHRTIDEHLEEMAREAKASPDVAGAQTRLGAEQEGRQGQEPVLVGLASGGADGAAGAGADVDEVVDGAGGGALGEVEAEAEVLQQPRLEADEHRRPDVGVGEGGAERFEGQESPWMWLAFGQGPGGDGRGRGEAAERQRIVEQGRGPGADGLQAGRAQLVGDAGAVAGDDPGPGLQDRLQPPAPAAGHVGGVAAVGGGEQLDDGPALAERPGGQHEGVVLEFHQRDPEPGEAIILDAEYEAALAELKALAERYRAEMVERQPDRLLA